MPPRFWTPSIVFSSAIALRLTLLIYGLLQDAYSPLKYTDIDYLVFTDAARYVSRGLSPYQRETYRYTPLLAWLLLPTTWSTSSSSSSSSPAWFSFGKVVFSVADIVAGWLVVLVLRSPARGGGRMEMERSLKVASVWLLNPMVATISTRGSSEGLLGVMVVALLWAVTHRRIVLAGVVLGLAVHFKIYPFIYASSIIWYLDSPSRVSEAPSSSSPSSPPPSKSSSHLSQQLKAFLNPARLTLALSSFATFMALNALMYTLYGQPFLQHTYLHHLTRIDHRHNFSPYSTLLYLSSSSTPTPHRETTASSGKFSFGAVSLNLESLAFVPQLGLSAVLIPLVLGKKDLPGTMLAQTWAFVGLNKVCTSQYFLWYIIFLPFYLPYSSFTAKPRLGITAAILWVGAQALWLQQAFQLEFLGQSTFVPGLWISSLAFYMVNMCILGVMIEDIGKRGESRENRARKVVQ